MENVKLYVFSCEGTPCVLAEYSKEGAQAVLNIEYGVDIPVFVSEHDLGEVIEINFIRRKK
jgi:hypothetical protein